MPPPRPPASGAPERSGGGTEEERRGKYFSTPLQTILICDIVHLTGTEDAATHGTKGSVPQRPKSADHAKRGNFAGGRFSGSLLPGFRSSPLREAACFLVRGLPFFFSDSARTRPRAAGAARAHASARPDGRPDHFCSGCGLRQRRSRSAGESPSPRSPRQRSGR